MNGPKEIDLTGLETKAGSLGVEFLTGQIITEAVRAEVVCEILGQRLSLNFNVQGQVFDEEQLNRLMDRNRLTKTQVTYLKKKALPIAKRMTEPVVMISGDRNRKLESLFRLLLFRPNEAGALMEEIAGLLKEEGDSSQKKVT